MSQLLSITRSTDDPGVVLALAGELDVFSAPELAEQLDALAADACPRVLLDLSRLSFVDSSGVSVLVKARHEADWNAMATTWREGMQQLYDTVAGMNAESEKLFPAWNDSAWLDLPIISS